MPVTSVVSDPEALTLTLVADFPVAPARLWEAFTDPRQLERFWGPPGYPATFEAFDFAPGGVAEYAMTGPRGDVSRARWEFTKISEPTFFEVIDSFTSDSGEPVDLPASRIEFSFSDADGGARVTSTTHFPSLEALEQLTAMGMVEGLTMGINQLDLVLQDLREYAQGRGTEVEILDDQHVRITRVIQGPREMVWRAHFEPELMQKWLLGPDGWAMPVCETSTEVGGTYRYEWEPSAGVEGERFGFEGEVLHVEPGRRAVTTERMIGMADGPTTINDLSLYEEDGLTLLTQLIEYPDAATRDMILETGMVDGMEASYARMEALVLA
ncbi:SRPBCC family protein [Microbacterium oryzae]|uniref:SRPBCC family protein n=1 Tax=Microbacterium oryzae TaxID=743009 RepID=UPI0025B0BC7C|nr:SRPBCC family protein [Microbacterium oryzae]MDN3312007.1 SRPBCC family protein [Microbacterium oryzae]